MGKAISNENPSLLAGGDGGFGSTEPALISF
jgi:hypothetical protein